ncbi:MAG: AAA family ATPase [Lysobacteraceae bacterium]
MTDGAIDPHLAALLAALQATPDNGPLRTLVLDACLDRGDVLALRQALDLCGAELLGDADRRARALKLLADAGEHDALLRVAPADSDEALMARARLLFGEGRRGEALDAYRAAIAANPAIEDAAFFSQLTGKLVSLADVRSGRGGEPVPSIANDDTAAYDMVRHLEPAATRIGFDDVGGLDEVKREIRRRIITPFLKPSLFQRFKRQSGGGILLYGPPGCGKTLLARATAGECGAKFYNVSITDVLDMYIGESERKLHEIFQQARRTAPAVVFFDEIEAIGGKRQHSREATSAKLVSQFLTELDGFAQNNQHVLVLGATNVPWAVDPAFRRPGRFDRVLFVPPPDAAARETILHLLLDGRPQTGDLDLRELVKRTSGHSGADLRNLVDTAADEASEESIETGRESGITMRHLREALARIRPTTLEWLTSARNHARYANQAGQYDDVLKFLDGQG